MEDKNPMNPSDKPLPGMFEDLEAKLVQLNDMLSTPCDFILPEVVHDLMLLVYESYLVANVLSREELAALQRSNVPVSPDVLNSLPGANNAIRAFLAGNDIVYRDLCDARNLVAMVAKLVTHTPEGYFSKLCYDKAFPIRK